MAVVETYGLNNCGPNGAAIGPFNPLPAGVGKGGRSVIIDKANGAVIADFSNVGGSDEVWFNPGDNHYYLAESARQNLGVIDAGTLAGSEVESGVGAHSVAADQTGNHIFVPINALHPACGGTYACIALYSSVTLENKGKPRACYPPRGGDVVPIVSPP